MQDLRFAWHSLRRSPGFTLAVTISLGLAMAANASMFGVVDALWLRPPGVQSPGTLARVFATTPTSATGVWSFPEYTDLRDRSASFAALAARGRRGSMLHLADGSTELELANVVSLNFFTMAGVHAAVGRLFTPDDEATLAHQPIVVLGNALWQRRFGADPAIVGRHIRVGREAAIEVMVLGVLPATFRDMDPATDRDLWFPPATWTLLTNRAEFEQRDYRWFELFGRRRPGASVTQANAEIAQLANALAQTYPDVSRGRGARVVSESSYRLESGGVNAVALLGLVLLVAVITCVNVANLLLARAAARARDIAVRIAVGASRLRLLGQLMLESVVLGGAGAATGLAIAAAIIVALPSVIMAPPGLRSFVEFAIDSRVLTFTLAVTLLTTLAFGLVPSWIAARPDVVPILKGETGLAAGFSSHSRVRAALVSAQIAVAVVVLCAAAVLGRSFLNSERADLGFTREPLLIGWITFGDFDRSLGDTLLDRVRALPGVRDAAIAIRAPLSLSGGGQAQTVYVNGTNPSPEGGLPEVKFNAVTPSYFNTMRVRLLEGRLLDSNDERDGPPVVLVSERFKRVFFPDGSAVGRVVRLGGPTGVEHQVVGVVADTVVNTVDEKTEPYFYVPFWRGRYGELTVIVDAGSAGGSLSSALRATLKGLDPRLEPRTIVTMTDLIAFGESTYRATALLAVSIALVGLLLTVVGVYGLAAYNATSRTREMGLRMALGADRSQVLGLMLRESLRLTGFGIAVGLPAALAVTRLLTSLLFNVKPWDGLSIGGAIAIVVALVVLATTIPARHAARVSPSITLRV